MVQKKLKIEIKKKKRLNSQLLETKIKLQNKGNDEILERILCNTKNKLRVLQQYKIQGQKIRAKENWMKDGDRGSKYFFNIIRAK